MLVVGLGFGAFAARWVLQGAGSGTNFARVPFLSLATDMLNAFSLGLSVDFARVRWLDYLFGAVAIVGALWAFRPRPTVTREAWLLPAFVIVPVVSLHLIQQFQPAYMNTRHMSMISGAFALLVAAGCAAVCAAAAVGRGVARRRVLVGGMIYSTVNYFTLPDYAKDNFAQVGADLAAEILPGDAIVLLPAQMVRLYRHYLPIDALEQATLGSDSGSATAPKGWAALPQLDGQWAPTEARLQEMFGKYRRVWLVASGMVPLGETRTKRASGSRRTGSSPRDLRYLSNTILELKLYLPQAPVLPEGPGEVEQPVSVVFGDKIRLDGFNIGEPLTDEQRAARRPLLAAAREAGPSLQVYPAAWSASRRTARLPSLPAADREPYYGHLPTVWWSPGPEIVEYTGLPGLGRFEGDQSSLRLAVQMYDAETLEKLPVTGIPEGGVLADDQTVLMPFPD